MVKRTSEHVGRWCYVIVDGFGLVVVSLLFILHFNMMLCSVLTSLHDVHASGVRPGHLANVEQTVDQLTNG